VSGRYFYPNARAVLSCILDGYQVGPDSPPRVISTVPVTASIHRNCYQQADSWSVEFDANDFPVAPTQIRTGQIELYIYQTEGLGDEDRSRLIGRKPSIVGLFDQTGIEYGRGERTFHIEGLDFTALLCSKQWDPFRRVPSGVPLSRFLETLLAEASPSRGGAAHGSLTLDFQADADPTIGATKGNNFRYTKKGKIRGRVQPRVKITTGSTESRRVKHAGYKPTDKVKHYWDLIFEVVTRYGLICFVEDFRLVVTTPRSRLDEADAQDRLRKLSWGRNLDSLRWERNMGKDRTPQIKVVSWDAEAQRIVSGVFPKDGRKAAVGIGTNFEEVQTYTLYDIHDEATLERAAESIYDQRARGESRIVITTDDLADNDGRDLLDIRAGDPLLISFDPFNLDELRARGNARARAQYMVSRGFRPQIAQAFSDNLDALIAFRKPFRVREADIEWSNDTGISVEAELQEFISIQEAQ
jgi:hypothetical protein